MELIEYTKIITELAKAGKITLMDALALMDGVYYLHSKAYADGLTDGMKMFNPK